MPKALKLNKSDSGYFGRISRIRTQRQDPSKLQVRKMEEGLKKHEQITRGQQDGSTQKGVCHQAW